MSEELQNFTPESQRTTPNRLAVKVVIGVILFILFASLALGTYLVTLNQPMPFTTPITVTISEGDSVPIITDKLEQAGVIQSSELLYLILVTQFDPTKIKASQYVFTAPLTTVAVAKRLIEGDFATNLVSVTVFEGESREKIASRLAPKHEWFDATEFLFLSEELEGKLFPDTYFIPQEDFSTTDLVALLNDTYRNVIAEYETQIQESTMNEQEILTLASIVEREANTPESMQTVAGIFFNRLEIGMPLQADASIEYVLEHEIKDLPPGELAESLREVDSPYNTYLYPGLPPTPIGNPGRMAIEAVLEPLTTDYLYYITGNNGEFYYAETYNQHLINIENYLK